MRWGILALALVVANGAAAAELTAKEHFERGSAAFALGRYAEAATEYEAAFDLQPQPALLYDAATAHRAAGNHERALLLYQNYLRLYPDAPNGDDARHLIEMLQKSIAAKNATSTSPPSTPVPPETKPDGKASSSLTAAPPARPRKKQPKWVWGVVGGAAGVVVVGLAVGLSVGLSGTSYPSASMTVTVK